LLVQIAICAGHQHNDLPDSFALLCPRRERPRCRCRRPAEQRDERAPS